MSDIETITLHSAGPVPGIPGTHAPGRYIINWIERTITPVEEAITAPARKTKPTPAPAEPDADSASTETTPAPGNAG